MIRDTKIELSINYVSTLISCFSFEKYAGTIIIIVCKHKLIAFEILIRKNKEKDKKENARFKDL